MEIHLKFICDIIFPVTTGGVPPDWKYYGQVDMILGCSHKTDSSLGDDSLSVDTVEENLSIDELVKENVPNEVE